MDEARDMHGPRETDDGKVRWLDLVRPRRSLERRVRRSAHLDALRGVRSPAGPDGGRHPAAIAELAAWEASTLSALSGHIHGVAGRHTARVDDLRMRIAALGPDPEQRLAMVRQGGSESGAPAPLTASHPAAQLRRRLRLDADRWAVVDADRAVLQAELVREEGLRAAAIEEARETARQCHESALALQHLYWAVRTRWSRRRHGAAPAPAYAEVPLPAWVAAPETLYGGRRHERCAS
jgi:hypothetical protein